MHLQCICGRAGSGKTHYLARAIADAVAQGHSALLIVPDQYTLQAEQALIKQMGTRGLMDAEVLSFTRLCERVLEQTGGLAKPMLDQRGRAMAVSRILLMEQDAWHAYGKYVHSPHFASTLAGEIGELKRFDIRPEQLAQAADGQARLLDIAHAYAQYEKNVGTSYADTQDRLNQMIEQIPSYTPLQHSCVFIDGFEMLTSQIYRAVRALLQQAVSLHITFRLGQPNDADWPLFAVEEKHHQRVLRIAEQIGATVSHLWLPLAQTPRLPAHADLRHAERTLFASIPTPYEQRADHIRVFRAASMTEEAEHCAQQILALAQDDGMRFREIAVVAADLTTYGPLLERAFAQYGIPSFLDCKRTVATHPLARYVLLSLRVIQRNYAAKDVLALGKTGYTALCESDLDELEQLLLTKGIRWLSASYKPPLGEDSRVYSGLRDTLLTPQYNLQSALRKAATAAEQAQAIAQFLQDSGAVARADMQRMQMAEQGDRDGAMEIEQVYQTIGTVLHQLHDVLGGTRLPNQTLYDLLSAGLAAEEVGILPTSQDAVQVGTVTRSRMGDLRALFILGFNEGVLPAGITEAGLFSREDKQKLQQRGLYLGHDDEERLCEEEAALYGLIAKPSDKLLLSYCQAKPDGSAAYPSSVLVRLLALFPTLREQTAADFPYALWRTPQTALLALADARREQREAEPVFVQTERTLRQLGMALPSPAPYLLDPELDDIGPGLSQALADASAYDASIVSPTTLERMARCPFLAFAEGMLLRPPQAPVYGHSPQDVGNYYHHVMRPYVHAYRAAKRNGEAWTKEKSDAAVDAICQEVDQNEFLTGIYREDARAHQAARQQRIAMRTTCWCVSQQMEDSEYQPEKTEIRLSQRVELPGGDGFTMRGTIDRLDMAKVADTPYVRIIDYKKSGTDVDYTALFYGTSLQLPLYTGAAAQQYQARPGGAFFIQLQDGDISAPPERAERMRRDLHRMQGVYDIQTAELMAREQTLAAHVKGGHNHALTAEQFDALIAHGYQTAADLYVRKQAGVTHPFPLKQALDSCAHCALAAACGFEEGNHACRRAQPVSKDAFFEEVRRS